MALKELRDELVYMGYDRWRVVESLGLVEIQIPMMYADHVVWIHGDLPVTVGLIISGLPWWRCRFRTRRQTVSNVNQFALIDRRKGGGWWKRFSRK